MGMFAKWRKRVALWGFAVLVGFAGTAPGFAQISPTSQQIDGDLVGRAPPPPVATDPLAALRYQGAAYAPQVAPPQNATPAPALREPSTGEQTYDKNDLIGAAEGVFGTGAHGLADMIQDILKKQGRPNAYITGREAGGALVVGLRYGSGALFRKGQSKSPVYWTGPSIGFDAGANAAKTFVLVYNLYRDEDLYHRFTAGEGQAYLVGGFNVSYLRYGDVVLIPVRMGVGLRLGVNGGYMKIRKSQHWVPF